MPRLNNPRHEGVAWARAAGMNGKQALSFAGLKASGDAYERMKRKPMVERIEELTALMAWGAGPDEKSQMFANLARSAQEMGGVQGITLAARMGELAFAAKAAELAARGMADPSSAGATVTAGAETPEGEAPRPTDFALDMESWIALARGAGAPAAA